MSKPVIGVIAARYNSFRFPGKALALIAGKTLIQHTYENARRSPAFDQLVVATDDTRIYDHVTSFGGKAVMTSPDCPTGSDRVAQVIRSDPSYARYDIVINLQGDEPCVDPEVFDLLSDKLQSDTEAVMATPITPIRSRADAESYSIVKCVPDLSGRALYFSRGILPCGHGGLYRESIPYYRHIGIYAFRRDFLLRYATLPPTPLQLAEDLEQLKILEHGYRIGVVVVDEPSIGVDTPQDISRIEALLCKRNTSLSPAGSVPR